jgi:hypothetical protein
VSLKVGLGPSRTGAAVGLELRIHWRASVGILAVF